MTSNNLYQANKQWMSRPDDERFTSLDDMLKHFKLVRDNSRALVTSTSRLEAIPGNDGELALLVDNEAAHYEPTNWSFGQLASLANAPAGYLRTLPPEMSADCLNYGLRFNREIEDVGLLVTKNGHAEVRAATGPRYGRIWNSDITQSLVNRFGDGVTGQWKVPGEFGKAVTVTKQNTTLYASDRDMFVFLCDEQNRIEVPNRRDGKSGSMARGFFVWNSEVGASTFGLGMFLFDFVCCNRIIWGADQYREIKLRHTVSAPDKFLHEVAPSLQRYSESATGSVTESIEAARKDKLSDVNEFLAKRYSRRTVQTMSAIHQLEENRPIETRWDVVVAATAYARTIPHTNERVEFERSAGDLLNSKN